MTQTDLPQALPKSSTANPGPLGLCGFALTTLVLSMANANVLGTHLTAFAVLPLALTFGGAAQMLAGMWEFKVGNTFGATAFTAYGAFWIGIGLFLLLAMQSPGFKPGDQALSTILLGWTIFTGVMVLGAVRVNGATASLFLLLFVTFILLTIGAFSQSSGITALGGYLGIVTALNAFYNAAAGILKDMTGQDILPVFAYQH